VGPSIATPSITGREHRAAPKVARQGRWFDGLAIARRPVVMLMAVLPLACYSFSARTARHIRSVAVPFLDNETVQYGLAETLTDALVAAFVEDNQLRVVPEEQADSIIEGRVTGYRRVPQVYRANESVQLFRVHVAVSLSYRDLVRGETVWEDTRLEEWGEYSLSGEGAEGRTTEEEAQEQAVEKIVKRVITRTVESW
jgi:hypothetical protein